jgi:hypothetical protein
VSVVDEPRVSVDVLALRMSFKALIPRRDIGGHGRRAVQDYVVAADAEDLHNTFLFIHRLLLSSWALGNPEGIRRFAELTFPDPDDEPALEQRINRLLGTRSTIDPRSKPYVDYIRKGSPLAVTVAIPLEWAIGGGLLGLLTLAQYMVTFPLRVSTKRAELEAMRAEFIAQRDSAELQALKLQARALSMQDALEMRSAELLELEEERREREDDY